MACCPMNLSQRCCDYIYSVSIQHCSAFPTFLLLSLTSSPVMLWSRSPLSKFLLLHGSCIVVPNGMSPREILCASRTINVMSTESTHALWLPSISDTLDHRIQTGSNGNNVRHSAPIRVARESRRTARRFHCFVTDAS